MSTERWIVIPRWDGPDGFQHYKNREPTWIKNYTRLLNDEEYRSLTMHQRGVLHGLWLEYAASNRQIPDSTLSITRRLGERVTRATLEALNHAGFIQFSASKPLATRYQAASTEAEVDKEKERPSSSTSPQDRELPDLPFELELAKTRLRAELPALKNGTMAALESYGLPPAAWHAAAEELHRIEGIQSPVAYAIGLFKAWKAEGRYQVKA